MKLSTKNIVISLLVVVGLIITALILLRPEGKVAFTLAPADVTLTIGTKKQSIHRTQILSLQPGKYSLTFSREGFSTETAQITVENKKTTPVLVALTPLNDTSKKLFASDQANESLAHQYEQKNFTSFLTTLPQSGVGYSISSCDSLQRPAPNQKAICLAISNNSAKNAALQLIRQAGVNPNNHELLFGTEDTKLLISADSYKVEYYANIQSDKPAIYITPLTVDFNDTSNAAIAKLEAIKAEALAAMKAHHYDPQNYTIYYSNYYLSKYNPLTPDEADHAEPPIYNP